MRHRIPLLLCSTLLCSAPLAAQSAAASGSIGGTITDPNGAAVPSATVILRQTELAQTRTMQTDERGEFVAALLPPGAYTIEVKAQGFTAKRPVRLTLGVGASVRVAVKMAVAGSRSEINVTGRAETSEGNTLPPAVNKTEPETGNTLAGLTVTYLPNRDRDFTSFTQLSAGVEPATANANQVSVAGQRAASFNAAVDGAEIRDPLNGGMRGTQDQALFFPQTAVREFTLVRSGATAEVGDTNAGFLNIATKAGSNKLHGEAFYLGRPSAFVSRDAFGHSLDSWQNEVGGSVGGPIKKDKAFWYAGVEHDSMNTPWWTQFATAAPALLASVQQQVESKSTPTALFGRTDFNLSSKNTLNLEADYNHAHATNLNEWLSTRSLGIADQAFGLRGDSLWLRANLTTSLSSTKVNQFLAQWADDHRDFEPNSTAPEQVIHGFGVLGGNASYPYRYTSELRESSDDLTISHGPHLLHFGASFAGEPAHTFRETNLNGRYDYLSVSDYLAGFPYRFQQTTVSGNALYSNSVQRVGVYTNDRWTLNKQLTVTAGLRYDAQVNPRLIPSAAMQWQPRLGLAWNPHANTVIRASAGIYDAPVPGITFARVYTDNGSNTFTADTYYGAGVNGLISGIANHFRNPHSGQLAASVEQQFSPKFSASAGYLHNSSWDLTRLVNANLFPPVAQGTVPVFSVARPIPSVGQFLQFHSDGHSNYDALTVTGQWQWGRRSNLTANYTLAQSHDDAPYLGPFGGVVGPVIATNPYDASTDRGYSDFDVRHNFNISSIVNLPLGFKANPLLVTHSGLPYTPILGRDANNDSSDWNDRTAARNSLRQPAFFNLDLRFVKDFTLKGEGHHLDLFLDILNLTGAGNRNFGPYAVSLAGTPTYGQPLFAPLVTQLGSARQIQFTARLVAF